MLGRLRMSIDQCEEAYVKLSEDIFTPRYTNDIANAYSIVNAEGRFSTQPLEANIKRLIDHAGLPESEKFDDRREDSCKPYGCVHKIIDVLAVVQIRLSRPPRRWCKYSDTLLHQP